MTDPAALVRDADAATAAGDLARAEELLATAGETGGAEDPSLWMKLGAVQRARGRFGLALASVHRALTVTPLDFTALLMRASLMERLRNEDAPEAWSQALAQKPEGDLPAHLTAVVTHGEEVVRQWTAEREHSMAAAMAASDRSADPEERRRLERFRNNVLRRTRPYHSEPTHFHFPGLIEREFHPRELFPWLDTLEQSTDVIAAEFRAVMAAERAELAPYVKYPEHMPLDQWKALNNNADWTAIHLLKNGERIEANARLCPHTLDLLARLDQPQVRGASPNAMFSLLAPRTRIPPHVGVSNARLVCHLPLVVPDGCWFRVGAETRLWQPGNAFVFDDTIEHEACNPTDQLRVVFIFDLWNPDLSAVERAGVAALMEADPSSRAPL